MINANICCVTATIYGDWRYPQWVYRGLLDMTFWPWVMILVLRFDASYTRGANDKDMLAYAEKAFRFITYEELEDQVDRLVSIITLTTNWTGQALELVVPGPAGLLYKNGFVYPILR
jgi:hypothetical protein